MLILATFFLIICKSSLDVITIEMFGKINSLKSLVLDPCDFFMEIISFLFHVAYKLS